MADFSIKQGDRLPALRATLKDQTGAAVDLSAATVVFNMRHKLTRELVVDNAAAASVDDANGIYEYQWAAGDTDTAGDYIAEFEATISGKVISFPNADYISVRVTAEVG